MGTTADEPLLLVRHGVAEGNHPDGDHARRLTEEGRIAFMAMARSVAARTRVRRIVASPYARAAETARLLAEALGGVPVEERPELAFPAASGESVAALAASLGPGTALVGHAPSVAEAVSVLAGPAGSGIRFRPGTVAALLPAGDGWRVDWVSEPDGT